MTDNHGLTPTLNSQSARVLFVFMVVKREIGRKLKSNFEGKMAGGLQSSLLFYYVLMVTTLIF